MTDLADVSPGDIITSARQNLINDYIQDGTHRVTTEAIYIAQTSVAGNSLRIARSLASGSTDSPVVEIVQDNASDDQPTLKITNYSSGGGGIAHAIYALNYGDQQVAYLKTETQGAGCNYVGFCSGHADYGRTLYAFRNLDSTKTGEAVATIIQDHASDDQDALSIKQDGKGYGIFVDMSAAVSGAGDVGGKGVYVKMDWNDPTNNWAFWAGDNWYYNHFAAIFQGSDQNDGARSALFYRALSSTNTAYPMVEIWQANASDDQNALTITNAGLGTGLFVKSTAQTTAAVITNTLAGTNTSWIRFCNGSYETFSVRRNFDADTYAVAEIYNQYAGADAPILQLVQDGTGPWIDFEGTKAVSTGKSSANEYIQVKTASGTRYLQLFT